MNGGSDRADTAALRAVAFDLDGTLVDSLGLVTRAYIATIAAHGGPSITAVELEAAWHLGPTPVVLEHFLGHYVPSAVDHFLQSMRIDSRHLAPFPGVRKLLARLASDGVGLAVVTNATRANALLTLTAAGLDSLIGVTVCADEVDPKPSPAGLLTALSALGATPSQSVYVGDSWVDLACARAASVRGVHARWTPPGRCDLAGAHDCVETVDSLDDVLAASASPAL